MPTFHVTSPDGRTIEVNAPEGATEDQAIKYAQDNWETLSKQAIVPEQPTQPTQPDRPFAERLLQNIRTVTDPVRGMVEAPLSLATGLGGAALGGLAQIGTAGYEAGRELLGGEPVTRPTDITGQQLGSPAQEVGREVSQAFTYQPKSETGQAITRAAGQLASGFGLVPYLAEKGREAERGVTGGRTYLTDTLYGAAAAAPVVGKAKVEAFKDKGLVDKQEELNRQRALNYPTDSLTARLETPDQNGLKFITPAKGGVEAQLSTIHNKTNQAISAVNEESATRMAANEIGLPKDKPFTPETIKDIENEANKAYSNIVEQSYGQLPPKPTYEGGVSIGTMAPKMESAQATIRQTPQFRDAIQAEINRVKDISSGNESAFRSLKKVEPVLRDELKNLKQDPKSVLRRVQLFREQAKETMGSSAPSKIDLEQARAKMFIANKLEDLLEQNLEAQGKTGLVQQMRNARVKLAQINAIQDSLTVDGKISIKKLAKIDEKTDGKLLTGNLKRIAEMGRKFPEGAKDIKGPVSPFSMFDAILGTASLAAGHAEGVALVAGKALVPTLAKIGALQTRTPSYVAKPSAARAGTVASATGVSATQAEQERKRRKAERNK